MQGRYHLGGKEFDLTTEDMEINSTNFSVSKNGDIKATSGEIGGFTLGKTKFASNFSGIYDYNQYDLRTAIGISMGWLYPTVPMIAVEDYNNDGQISAIDFNYINRILNKSETNTKIVSGNLEINAEDSKKCLVITTNGTPAVSLGAEGIDANMINAENVLCGYREENTFTGVLLNGHTGQLTCVRQITGGSIETTEITPNGIVTPAVTQTSLESAKKNFKRLESGLDIIKNIDIYKYNLKNEEDNTKKHIGFVIGDEYKYSKDITSKNNDGVDLYSFVSVCCKAIQEQQAEIEMLKDKINKLEGGEK